MPSVMLIDDHALVLAGIKELIEKNDRFSVVAEAGSYAEAIDKIDDALPEIVITDITLNSGDGLEIVKYVKQHSPATPVLVLSMHSSPNLVRQAFALGANGYLVKEAVPQELEIALQAISKGESFLSSKISVRMMRHAMEADQEEPDQAINLTARQLQILRLLVSGKGNKEIALELELSEKTIAAHRAQIMSRLNIKDFVGLVLYAVKQGIIKVDE